MVWIWLLVCSKQRGGMPLNSHFLLPGRYMKAVRSVFLLSVILGSSGCTGSPPAKEEAESGKPDVSVIRRPRNRTLRI